MILKTYAPMPRFPALSLSGTRCELHCRHCDATYLGAMLPAETPEALLTTCRRLHRQGAVGVLLSGGSDRQGGILNLGALLDAIRQVKQETGLIINIHPGLLDDSTARQLTVDFASLEIPSTGVIRDVFGLSASTDDYVATYRRLQAAGIDVVPHVSVYAGDEDRLLEHIKRPQLSDPNVIVVIVFSPTKHTAMAEEHAPTPEMVAGVITRVRAMFPNTELSLGCMRPRTKGLRDEIEIAALEAGVSRMELPSRKTRQHALALGYELCTFDACCALPVSLEPQAIRR